MGEKVYNKLVRDNIIDQIKNSGKTANYSILKDNELFNALNQKLLEEVNEFITNNAIDELADVFEVILKIMSMNNTNFYEVEKIRKKKKKENGGFDKNIFLINVME